MDLPREAICTSGPWLAPVLDFCVFIVLRNKIKDKGKPLQWLPAQVSESTQRL